MLSHQKNLLPLDGFPYHMIRLSPHTNTLILLYLYKEKLH